MAKEISVGQELWIVAAAGKQDQYFDALNSNAVLNPRSRGRSNVMSEDGPWKFNVPDGDRSLTFGSFDNLIRLTDELQKCDSQLDSVVHRLERQYLEIDPKASFKLKSQRKEFNFVDYIQNWQWDEAKYPRTRSISDNLTLLMQVVNKLDEEARNKTAQYNESKTQRGNLAKKDGAGLVSRDLIDVLTPSVVQMNGSAADDFITTEHLATVVVILPRGIEAEFLQAYETLCEKVIPMSAKKFQKLDDKDGCSLWRVVVFKSAVETFKKACREKRYIPRDFEYSEEAYNKLLQQRENIEEAVKRQLTLVKGLYQAAWSDAMIAWMHIKAMRVFVESVLRFGMPPRFASFVVVPQPGTQTSVRKALADILGKGAAATGTYAADKMADAAGEDGGEEYFPYVSFSFTPFTAVRP